MYVIPWLGYSHLPLVSFSLHLLLYVQYNVPQYKKPKALEEICLKTTMLRWLFILKNLFVGDLPCKNSRLELLVGGTPRTFTLVFFCGEKGKHLLGERKSVYQMFQITLWGLSCERERYRRINNWEWASRVGYYIFGISLDVGHRLDCAVVQHQHVRAGEMAINVDSETGKKSSGWCRLKVLYLGLKVGLADVKINFI